MSKSLKIVDISIGVTGSEVMSLTLYDVGEVLRETNKTYVVGTKLRERVIRKRSLLKPTTIFDNIIRNETPTVSYTIRCLNSDKDTAETMLKEALHNRVMLLAKGSNALLAGLQKMYKHE